MMLGNYIIKNSPVLGIVYYTNSNFVDTVHRLTVMKPWLHLQNSSVGRSFRNGKDVCVPTVCTDTAATRLALLAISSSGIVG